MEQPTLEAVEQSIYTRTVSSRHILCALLNCFILLYGLFGQSNMHRILDFGPDQPGRNEMYQSEKVAKVLRSNLYTVQ